MNMHSIILVASAFACGLLHAGDASPIRKASPEPSSPSAAVAALEVLATVPASPTRPISQKTPPRHQYAHSYPGQRNIVCSCHSCRRLDPLPVSTEMMYANCERKRWNPDIFNN